MNDWEGLMGYFAYGTRDRQWGPVVTRPGNGHIRTAPVPPARRRRPSFSHDLGRLQTPEQRTDTDRAAIRRAIAGINELAERLGWT